MVRIFRDKSTGDFVVQTTCLDAGDFVSELAEAMSDAMATHQDEKDLVALGVLTNAMPIAFKLSGYKADNVQEQRTLVCGNVSPQACELISTVGK
jgi:orotate phosphoribosyltransferase-like protein